MKQKCLYIGLLSQHNRCANPPRDIHCNLIIHSNLFALSKLYIIQHINCFASFLLISVYGMLFDYYYYFIVVCNSKGQWCTGIIPPDQYQHKLRERRRSLCEEGDITEIKIEEDEDSDQSVFKRLSCQALIEESVAERRKLQQNNNQTVQKQSCCTIS